MKYPSEQEKQDIRTRWFKEHVARLVISCDHLTEIVWKKPDSSIYSVRYIVYYGTLFVCGDLGEAVYSWGGSSEQLTPQWIAGRDLHYFHSKLRASDEGDKYASFNFAMAVANLRKEVSDGNLSSDLLDGLDYTEEDQHAFIEHLRNQGGDCDSETLSGLVEAGYELSLRCAAHLIGLQMAVEQLAKQAAAPVTEGCRGTNGIQG